VRIDFHVDHANVAIRDREGVDVSELQAALRRAKRVIAALRCEDPTAAQAWSEWRLEVMDAAGQVLVSLDLDSPTP